MIPRTLIDQLTDQSLVLEVLRNCILEPFKVFYADDDEHEIMSSLFHIHEDLDACLIRAAADISDIVGQTPCIKKVGATFIG